MGLIGWPRMWGAAAGGGRGLRRAATRGIGGLANQGSVARRGGGKGACAALPCAPSVHGALVKRADSENYCTSAGQMGLKMRMFPDR